MNMNKIFGLMFVVCLGLCLFSMYGFSEDVAIIDPVIETGYEPPIEPDPEIQPETDPGAGGAITAAIDIDPNVLNLKSSRKFITAYIELSSGYDVNDIDISSVKLSSINGQQVGPVAALVSPSSVGDEDADQIPDLMVKFDYNQVSPLILTEQVKIGITGVMNGGLEFAGEDTIKALNIEAAGGASAEKRFRFQIGKNLEPGVKINKALLWLKYPNQKGPSLDSWLYKALKKWEQILGSHGNLAYSELKTGQGYEWDVTDQVTSDWQQGLTDVVVKFDEQDLSKYPLLVVAYEGGSEIEQDAALQGQKLKSVGKKYNLECGEIVSLNYSDGDLQGIDEKDLGVYSWDKSKNSWELVPGATVNRDGNVVTFEIRNNTFYQLMAPKSQSAANPEKKSAKPNTLGQNYPNPFNPSTTINYSVSKDCHVTLKLYNIAGELVATVVDEYQRAGEHSAYFDGGERLSRGVYYYQLIAGDFVDTKRMVVLR